MKKPIDRLPSADCAHMEATLTNGEAAGGDGVADGADAESTDAGARCPLCHRDRRGPTLSVERLDVLQFRFGATTTAASTTSASRAPSWPPAPTST